MVKLGMVDPIALLTSENVQFPIGRWRCCCRPYVKVARRQLWKNSRRCPMFPMKPGHWKPDVPQHPQQPVELPENLHFRVGSTSVTNQPLLQRSWNINGQIKILNRSNISPSHIHLKLLLAEWTPLIYAAVEDCADWKHWRSTMKCVSAIVIWHCQGVAFYAFCLWYVYVCIISSIYSMYMIRIYIYSNIYIYI